MNYDCFKFVQFFFILCQIYAETYIIQCISSRKLWDNSFLSLRTRDSLWWKSQTGWRDSREGWCTSVVVESNRLFSEKSHECKINTKLIFFLHDVEIFHRIKRQLYSFDDVCKCISCRMIPELFRHLISCRRMKYSRLSLFHEKIIHNINRIARDFFSDIFVVFSSFFHFILYAFHDFSRRNSREKETY